MTEKGGAMKRLALALLLLTLPAQAADVELTQKFQVDLNRDGRKETVALKPFTQDGVTLGQLVVLSDKGRTIWAGPRTSKTPYSPSEPLVFGGEFDRGDIEVVGDLDGDGTIELLGTFQKSDLSPTRFRLLRWKKDRFVHVRSDNLVQAPQRPGTYVWAKRPEASVWIDAFQGLQPNRLLKVKILDARDTPQDIQETVRMTTEGFTVAR